MLLPSALPCDIMAVTKRPQRPKLLSFANYAPSQQDSYAGGLLSSCRALHSILGGPQMPSLQLQIPDATTYAGKLSPFVPTEMSRPQRCMTPPRGPNKRRRDEFEGDEDEKENIPHSPRSANVYKTPKRRRCAPLNMPLGLDDSDFASLKTPLLATPQRKEDEDIEMPPPTTQSDKRERDRSYVRQNGRSPTSPQRHCSNPRSDDGDHPPDPDRSPLFTLQQEQWSPLDDRRLVEVVLSKLSLTKREWNDCAKQLGKDKDSLGRRWRLLVGEGNVGLRRGSGRHGRGDLDIKSW